MRSNAHAMIASAPRFCVQAHPDKIFLPFGSETLTVALRKGDWGALNFFNNWITMRGSDGWLDERYVFWFKDQSAWKHLVAPTE